MIRVSTSFEQASFKLRSPAARGRLREIVRSHISPGQKLRRVRAARESSQGRFFFDRGEWVRGLHISQ